MRKSDKKFEEKLTCDLENEMRHYTNFHQNIRKSQNKDFTWILLGALAIIFFICSDLLNYLRNVGIIFITTEIG